MTMGDNLMLDVPMPLGDGTKDEVTTGDDLGPGARMTGDVSPDEIVGDSQGGDCMLGAMVRQGGVTMDEVNGGPMTDKSKTRVMWTVGDPMLGEMTRLGVGARNETGNDSVTNKTVTGGDLMLDALMHLDNVTTGDES